MWQQQSFEFARDSEASPTVEKRASESQINRKLHYMQSLAEDDPQKDVLAKEILQWILER